ncbi:MAG TPA: peroxiredoxin [Petrotogaceae bacterium]|nr:peroxiredoxin [Petrotogaceae bacterium]HOG34427.1 peroxiredoxin [Petrotogaceae bacterium]HOT31955.1 peroxiredoxin [Petrotogaceae bacterium]HPA92492.1 peroxiredoxin [Petrotogaceae bacterium]HPX15695.1 peroxiredoxin [Petrotogaceae bacterium]
MGISFVPSIIDDFVLKDYKNEDIKSIDFRGKWIVLYFYPKDGTAGCTKEANDFSSLIDDFLKEETVVIGISPDKTETHKKFILKNNLKIILLSDPEKVLIEKLGVWQLKQMYGKQYYGVSRTTFILDSGMNVRYVWKKVRVNGHAQEVLNKLIELKANK